MTTHRPWNWNSHVTACTECGGSGKLETRTGVDSYRVTGCDWCAGPHEPECEVCGFTVEVPGYDCLACETVYNLPDELLNADTATKLAAAIMRAVAMAWRDIEAPLPTASEATVPAVTL